MPKIRKTSRDAHEQALLEIQACLEQGERGTHLDLARFNLTELPPEIGQLSSLLVLDVSHNQLASLPPEIGRLSSLSQLIAYDNQLTEIPLEIAQLTKLTKLFLFNNKLTLLPSQIGDLIGLKILSLSGNQLSRLPSEIGRLSGLTGLALNSNRLTVLPREIGNLTSLNLLYLHENPALGLSASVLGPSWQEVRDRKISPAKPRDILEAYFAIDHSLGNSLTVATKAGSSPLSYDVFVSAKSQDYQYARVAAMFLRDAGLRVFFSEIELQHMGNSDYFDAIDTALEAARHMLVVTTSRENVQSKWVKKEWQTFLNEKLSDRKSGNLVTLVCEGMQINELPLSLRQHEARPASDLPSLLNYFRA